MANRPDQPDLRDGRQGQWPRVVEANAPVGSRAASAGDGAGRVVFGISSARPIHAGIHQFHRPRRPTVAGNSSDRTTRASRRMPAPSPVARILTSVTGALDMATKARQRIVAALVTSRPVRAMPATTAPSVDPVASYSSRMRERMNTS